MPTTITFTNLFAYQLGTKLIDIDTDSIKVCLARTGFVFDKTLHEKLINIRTTTGATTLDAVAATKKFTRVAGSFVTDGFVAGNQITASGFGGGVDGVYTIDTVAALEIVVLEAIAGNISGGGDEALASDDELTTGFGYTQFTKTTGATTVTQDTTGCLLTYPTVTWTAAGGDIGPTPGAFLIDETVAGDTVVQYIAFDAEKTATDGTNFDIGNGSITIAT